MTVPPAHASHDNADAQAFVSPILAPATQVLDLSESVTDMMGMLRCLTSKDIRLVWTPGMDLWPVRVSPTQIAKVLMNLCVNARDEITGTSRISIACQNVVVDDACPASYAKIPAGEYVVLTMADDGAGIDGQTAFRILEPLVVPKEAGGRRVSPISSGSALAQGGFVDVHREPENGTIVRICLPRYRKGATASEPAPAEAPPSLPGGSETILVVDDESTILSLCGSALGKLGYNVLLAETPASALQLARQHAGAIDLLLTDVVMPQMDGRDLVGHIARRCPGIACVQMSGYTGDATARDGVLHDELGFLPKPFSCRELAEKVRRALDERKRTMP